MKKYEFTGETMIGRRGKTFYRIRAVRDFGNVHKGDLGGFVESEDNLSHDGNAWITRHACAHGDSRVYEDAIVTGWADVSGNAKIFNNAFVGKQTQVGNAAWICGNANVRGKADYMFFHGIGIDGRDMTCFRDKEGAVMVKVHPDFLVPVDELKKYAFEQYGNGQSYVEFCGVIDLINLHYGLI